MSTLKSQVHYSWPQPKAHLGYRLLKGLQLSDPNSGPSDRMDTILEIVTVNLCRLDAECFSPDRLLHAANTMFGWAIGGKCVSNNPAVQPSMCLKITYAEPLDHGMLHRLWDDDEVSGEATPYTSEQESAVQHLVSTYTLDAEGH